MLRRLCLLCAGCCLFTAGRVIAQVPLFDANMPSVPWFDHVRQPVPLSTEQGLELVTRTRQALLAGKSPEEMAALAPADKQSRVIFLGLGDGKWPERTYFAAGYDFASAWQAVLKILRNREEVYVTMLRERLQKDIAEAERTGQTVPASWRTKLQNPGHWDSLRLHIVQNALPVNDFSIRSSRILLSSLNGLAFRPADGLAFTPEQIMGRYLLSPERRLNISQIGNLIAETGNWGALRLWLDMANAEQKGRICLFEADCYYADAERAVRLFRGHPILSDRGAGDFPQYARQAADRLLEYLLPNGKLPPLFPEWVSGRGEQGEFLSCQAELALAFSRLALLGKEKKYAEAARNICHRLQKHCQKVSIGGGVFTVLVEDEDIFPGDKLQDSRKVVSLHTNALVCLALLEADAANKSQEFQPLVKELMKYIYRQMDRQGDFILLRLYPEMNRPLDDLFSPDGRIESAALAALALCRYAEVDQENRTALQQRQKLATDHLLQVVLKDMPLEKLPISPWLAELLARGGTDESPDYLLQCARLAIAAGLQSDTQPLFPDLFGVPRRVPSLTLAAEHTWVVACLADWLARQGKASNARDLLADAWPIWIFQQQARMDCASAAGLPNPDKYYYLFRDHLEDFGFDLNGQTTQIFSLLAVSSALQTLELKEFPRHEAQYASWQKAWTLIDSHPFCLDPSLVQDSQTEGPKRHIVGGLQPGQTVTVKTSGGKMTAVSPAVSSRVIERQSRAGRNKR